MPRGKGKKLKVAMLMRKFPEPPQTFVLLQMDRLVKSGIEVHVYCAKYDSSKSGLHNPGIIIHSGIDLPLSFSGKIIKILQSLPYLLTADLRILALNSIKNIMLLIDGTYSGYALAFRENSEFDIVHAQFISYLDCWEIFGRKKISTGKLIVSARGYDASDKYMPLLLRNMPGIDYILPVSCYLAGKFMNMGIPAERIRVLRSAVSLEKIKFKHHNKKLKGTIRLVSSGRLVEKKGYEFSIRTVKELTERGHDVSLTILGTGEMMQALRELTAEQGLEQRVQFAGWLPHEKAMNRLSDSDIFILHAVTTSGGDQEGIPNVVKEAMAAGLPVVSTLHSGIPEIIINGKTGFICPERDVHGMADAVESWISILGTPRAGRMLAAARDLIIKNFDAAEINRALMGIYRK